MGRKNLAFPDLGSSDPTTRNMLAILKGVGNKEGYIADLFKFQTWDPKLVSDTGMPITNLDTVGARYLQLGDLVLITLITAFNLAAPLANTFFVDNLPAPPKQEHSFSYCFSAILSDGGLVGGLALLTGPRIQCLRYDSVAFTAGAKSLRVSGYYEA